MFFAVDSSSSSLSESPTPLFDVGILLKAVKALSRDEILLRFADIGFPLPWERITEVFEPNIQVVGPLNNGIYGVIAEVCVMTRSKVTYGYYNAAFCNPATGEFKLLSTPPALRCCFDKQCDKQYYVFGCIQKASSHIVLDYKMVVITQRLDWYKAFVYSQGRGSWKPFCHFQIWGGYRLNDQNHSITQDLDFLPQVFVNGYCHWMAGHSVLRFDVTKEVFGLIAGPPKYEYPNLTDACCIKRGVFTVNDHLAAIIMIHDPLVNINHNIHVWMMKNYGIKKSWTKIHSCKFQFGGELKKFLGMLFSTDNLGIERMFFQDKWGMLLSYDCSSGALRDQCTSNSSMPARWTTMQKDGYNGSWTCWKTIGLSAYGETLEPLALECKDE